MMHLFYISLRFLQSKTGTVTCLTLFSLYLCCIDFSAAAQETKMLYNVKKGGKVIGTFTVVETSIPGYKTIQLESHVKTSFIISIVVDAKEESVFQNGVLSNSSVFRKVDDDEKVNKKHRLYGSGYVIAAGKKTDTLCCTKIMYNLMSLYCTEPVNIQKVYSDAHQQFLVIQKKELHTYRIDVPDGSYNTYFYKDGRCNKVEIHQSLYTIIMVLT